MLLEIILQPKCCTVGPKYVHVRYLLELGRQPEPHLKPPNKQIPILDYMYMIYGFFLH